ncbi:MAG: hypothetical protein IPK67_04750 [Planctomycetes bacterium]|jgi:hypothetical protein|nr:hypothetical protein [Planctomycetota bacterium]
MPPPTPTTAPAANPAGQPAAKVAPAAGVPTAVYGVRIAGFWNSTHRLSTAEGPLGVLTVQRNRWGMVVGGRYSPAKGEVLVIRRDPGLLRSQYSMWTEGKEWLGSSLRWHISRREVVLHTGSRPLRLLPLPGFRPGWTLQAPKTGEMARIHGVPLSRGARIEVFRKVETELLVFAYFIAAQILWESLWPGRNAEGETDPGAGAGPGRT